MNQRNRLYIMAFAAYTIALLVMAVLAWLVIQHSREPASPSWLSPSAEME